jgi:hypothetical protein
MLPVNLVCWLKQLRPLPSFTMPRIDRFEPTRMLSSTLSLLPNLTSLKQLIMLPKLAVILKLREEEKLT